MLSFRRSSWALPPDTLSMSLITQSTEHLSMVCGTCPHGCQNVDDISILHDVTPRWNTFTLPLPKSHLTQGSHFILHTPARQGFLQVFKCTLHFSFSGPLHCHTLCLASICPLRQCSAQTIIWTGPLSQASDMPTLLP
jgi:hypothetical protein